MTDYNIDKCETVPGFGRIECLLANEQHYPFYIWFNLTDVRLYFIGERLREELPGGFVAVGVYNSDVETNSIDKVLCLVKKRVKALSVWRETTLFLMRELDHDSQLPENDSEVCQTGTFRGLVKKITRSNVLRRVLELT